MSLYALRARIGVSSGRNKMGKMMMEAGDWLGHGGMVRGGVLTVQVRDLEKNAAMLIGKGLGESRGRGGGVKFGTKIGKVHAVLVFKCCFGIRGVLGHKMISSKICASGFLFNAFNTLTYFSEQYVSGPCFCLCCAPGVCVPGKIKGFFFLIVLCLRCREERSYPHQVAYLRPRSCADTKPFRLFASS